MRGLPCQMPVQVDRVNKIGPQPQWVNPVPSRASVPTTLALLLPLAFGLALGSTVARAEEAKAVPAKTNTAKTNTAKTNTAKTSPANTEPVKKHDRPPLHERIDLAIAAGGLPPRLCSDADFIRRIYLDLVGMVPTAEETRAFLEDQTSEKRRQLIDQLLADARFPRRMADLFDSLFMERRADKHVKSPVWEKYLYESFVANKPLHELCHEILSADGVDPKHRAPARFYLDREVDVDLLTRDVGRIFFGKDLQCAQCHDHPVIADYYQTDYYGIYAFLQRSVLFTDKKAKRAMLGEKAEGTAKYQSVFVPSSKGTMPPMLPSGTPMREPPLAKDAAYVVKPGKNVRPVAKFSLRELLAKETTTGKNLAFNRNFANRLWAMMMGRGLVEPVDLHHADNPPTHPALLEDLTGALAEMKFDVRAFLRELVLSRVYQREMEFPEDLDSRVAVADEQVKTLEAEQAEQAAALKPLAAKLATAEAAQENARSELEPLLAALNKAKKDGTAAQKPVEEAAKALAEKKAQATAQKQIYQVVSAAATQTAAAVVKLPKDTELKEAAAKFAARAEQLKAAQADFSKQLTKLQTAAHTATENLTAAKNEVRATEQDLADAQQRLMAARTATQQALARYKAGKVKVDQVEQLAAAAETVSVLGGQILAANMLDPKLETSRSAWVEAQAARQTLIDYWSRRFVIGALQPLTARQMTWSILQVTGQTRRQRAAAATELQKKTPLDEAAQQDPIRSAQRQREIYELAYKRLRGNTGTFVNLFAAAPGQPQDQFFATVDQALFFENGTVVSNWIAGGSELLAKLSQSAEPADLATELYLTVLSRRPSPREVEEVSKYLAARGESRAPALQELVWALLTSAEFRFNH